MKILKIPFNRSPDTIITSILEKERPLLSYIHLKCIIVISDNVRIAYKFLCDLTQDQQFPEIQEKL